MFDHLTVRNQAGTRLLQSAKLPITDDKEVDDLGRDASCFFVSVFRELDEEERDR